MAHRRVTAPLRVTERVDYALKSVVMLCLHEGDYLTTKAVADHHAMSQKMLASVLWNLRAAGILESRPGWHGGFRLARTPETIAVSAVIAAAGNGDDSSTALLCEQPQVLTATPEPVPAGDVVAVFWRALDDHVQGTLTEFSVADLARSRTLR
jgi:Rrf2 family protein